MKKLLTATTLAAVFLVPAAWAAIQGQQGIPSTADVGDWERMVMSEPCMNGEVSASGYYPSQSAEDRSRASM